jgi:hypothetical protein
MADAQEKFHCCCLDRFLDKHKQLLKESRMSYNDYIERLYAPKQGEFIHFNKCWVLSCVGDRPDSCPCMYIYRVERDIRSCFAYHEVSINVKDILKESADEAFVNK